MSNDIAKTLVLLDASALKESSCIRRLFNNVVLGYTSPINSNDIEFGTAVHKFKSHWRTFGHDKFGEALVIARDHYENTPMITKSKKKYLDTVFLQSACIGYATKYENDDFKVVTFKNGHDNVPLVEPNTRFVFPYYVDDEIEILMAGTMDEIGRFKDGIYCVADLKTSSIWDIPEYFKGYELSPQLIFYRWAIKKYAEAYPDSIFAEINASDVGCFIDGVFYSGKDKPIQYQRSRVMLFNSTALQEFENLINLKVRELVDVIKLWRKSGTIPIREGMLNGACQTIFGHCKFFNACATPDDFTYQTVLEQQYIKRQYNPLNHGI